MASAATNFEQPSLNWGVKDMYPEFQRFKQHVVLTFKGPLTGTEAKHKAGWLGMWINQQGRELYKTFKFEDREEDDPDIILKKIEDYVRPRQNKRVSRFRAHQRKQLDGESFDNFVKDLRLLVMDCEYTNTDDMLVDLIINGVKHSKVQERLLDQGQGLTLNKAIEIGQQYELSQSQMKLMRGEEVFSIKQKHVPSKQKRDTAVKTSKPQKNFAKPSSSSTQDEKCKKCGRTHEKGKCPAFGSTCNFCKKKNHWQAVCRQKQKGVHVLYEDDSDSELLCINTTQPVHETDHSSNKWLVNLQVNGTIMPFRIDTGAKCNIIMKSVFEQVQGRVKLNSSSKLLKSFTNHRVKPVGAATLPIVHRDVHLSTRFEVVDLCQENIISGDTAEKLELLQQIATCDVENTSHQELARDFPDLVNTSGTLPGEYSIDLKENAKGVIHPLRRIAASLKPRVIAELHSMEENGFITPVHEPTDWVSSMVVALRNDKIHICIDPKDLNQCIKREHHPMKTIDEVISSIPAAKVCTVLDAKAGFMQIKLDRKSSFLTTFNTPLGRYRWLRLPYGIRSAPEIYQRIMDDMLHGIEGAYAIIDDILITGKDIEHHDKIFKQVVARATEYNLKLNYAKCRIRQSRVPYMGHVLTDSGLEADPAKIEAITKMPSQKDREGVRRFLGLVQYLGKFIPNLSQEDAPLRSLLKSDVDFQWNPEQENSFMKLKQLCSQPPVLGYYDVNRDIEIECDASKDGLGAVILQEGKVIAYASRSLTETEKRYAQLEKEMLSIVYSLTKFHCYVFGKHVTVFNDHKPLEQIFNKPLNSAPMRLQKMMMRMQWYVFEVKYRQGKNMHISDALSRAYLPNSDPGTDHYPDDTVQVISVTETRYAEIQNYTQQELSMLIEVIMSGWPDTRKETPIEIRQYWDSRDQLTVADGIIFKGMRIVIPPALRKDMLKLVHRSHLGIVKCKQRAREAMY